MTAKEKAAELIQAFKGDRYAFGYGALAQVGPLARSLGSSVLVIANGSPWLRPAIETILAGLPEAGVSVLAGGPVPGSRPNSPYQDVYRIATDILHHDPPCLLAVGGGSTIDAAKAANVLACLGGREGRLEAYLGTGKVMATLVRTGERLRPMLAVQTAAGSAAHLTKYANVTDLASGQKKLIIDDAIVPPRAVFDYGLTESAGRELTLDGALDAFSHCLEVFYGIGPQQFGLVQDIALTAIELIVTHTAAALADPHDRTAREALGLASDLGGYAIMVGGTSAAHLTSFSLVDLASHGRACGIMNPYYTVFFAPAIQRQLQAVGGVLAGAGLIRADLAHRAGRDLGVAVAEGMVAFAGSLGCPTRLSQLAGF
ncbi:MAG: iron-containing alcohol dehydrogenase, partial [Phycisphaerae bacterium]|nr:iron-containing alcohol dehydrogenase [Phycisphaerae bacterium]